MIRTIAYNSDSSLGDLCLDLQDKNGKIYKNIVLAGENGSGKTRIFNTLYTFLTGWHFFGGGGSIEPFKHIEYDLEKETYKIIPSPDNPQIGSHYRITKSNGSKRLISNIHIKKDKADLRHYKTVYSPALTIFETKPLKNITAEVVDNYDYNYDNTNDFTKLKQLLIDLEDRDNDLLHQEIDLQLVKKHNFDESDDKKFKEKSNLSRFRKAFDKFFEGHLSLGTKKTKDKGIIDFLFMKEDKEVSIDSLSSGEKQIVFRGASLLRDINTLNNGIIFIDEPELSMHPKWRKKILTYYLDLFESHNIESSQIFIATHSEEVISKAIELENTIVIILKEEDLTVRPIYLTKENFCLYPICAAEVNYVAFESQTPELLILLFEKVVNENPIGDNQESTDKFIKSTKHYKSRLHYKPYSYKGRHYESLPTYIRNAIAHPYDKKFIYSQEELKLAIDLLRNIVFDLSNTHGSS